jgi:hypothetical protein
VLGKRLSKASLGELEAMLEAFLGAMDCILGATNQPRVETTAEDLLEDEKARLSWLCVEIEEEAKRRTPTNQADAETKARIIIRWAFHCGDGWPEIVAAATGAIWETHQ